MLGLCRTLGFTISDEGEDPSLVRVTLQLG
jgi:hypothetical protein